MFDPPAAGERPGAMPRRATEIDGEREIAPHRAQPVDEVGRHMPDQEIDRALPPRSREMEADQGTIEDLRRRLTPCHRSGTLAHFWQTPQKKVERPACTERCTLPRQPGRKQTSPSRP